MSSTQAGWAGGVCFVDVLSFGQPLTTRVLKMVEKGGGALIVTLHGYLLTAGAAPPPLVSSLQGLFFVYAVHVISLYWSHCKKDATFLG